ncbi:MAG: NYN domain-containing protein [Chloroflexota bacterium]
MVCLKAVLTGFGAKGYTEHTMVTHVFVDGYNVIRQNSTLSQYERQSLELARGALVTRLNNDPKLARAEITVVFDGTKGGLTREHVERKGRVRVIYSRLGETADEVIKRLVSACTGEVQVISNDRELRDHATAHGGIAIRVARPVIPRRPTPDDEDDNRRPDKKGPSHRQKKRDRGGDPHWSP